MEQEIELEKIPMTAKIDENTTLMALRREEQQCSCAPYRPDENDDGRDFGLIFIWELLIIAIILVAVVVKTFVLN